MWQYVDPGDIWNGTIRQRMRETSSIETTIVKSMLMMNEDDDDDCNDGVVDDG